MSADRMRDESVLAHDVIGDEILGDERVSPPQPRPAAPAVEEPEERKSNLRMRLLLAGLVVLIVGGLFAYFHGGRYESTDNAQLQSGMVGVAANVSGQVVAIEVHENQVVKAGQVLFRIDARPFQAAVDEAEAKLADARSEIGAQRATYRQNLADVGAAQARLTYAVAEAARQKQLLAEGISSRNQYDQAVLAVETARQGITTGQQKAESVRAALSDNVEGPVDGQPGVQAAIAVLDRAKLNLSYTIVRAPQDGIVTRVNQLQIGSYVSAARPVFTMMGQRIWVEANFKENQLRHMRVGQPATVEIDAYSGRKLKAHIASFSPGTGNSFALLPAENATGNWVKVVQRLPVEVELDEKADDVPLHAGLSATVTVDTGHVRRLFGDGGSK